MKPTKIRPGAKAILSVLVFSAFSVSPASGCLWDEDTLAMEKSRFPGASDLITGNFPRHSKEFHQWRIEKTQKELEKDPKQLPLYDDLAVSQHKLGDHLAACETMKAKELVQPGIYETYSNMGTFLIYTGDLPKALDFINKALSINPQAHFGREQYQKWLVEWVMAGKPAQTERPVNPENLEVFPFGYSSFVLSKQPIMEREVMTAALRREAVQGILGMMRFADYGNPILQEALGDLLCTGSYETNASHLASLAYLQASQNATIPEETARLRKKFDIARSTFMDGDEPASLELELKKANARAEESAAAVRKNELAWIAGGEDASAEFTKKYLVP